MLLFLVENELDPLTLPPDVAVALLPLVAAALDPDPDAEFDALFEFEFDAEAEVEDAARKKSQLHIVKTEWRNELVSC